MATPARLPRPDSDDSDDVIVALETAGALWAKGESREALRWLRRAAETAVDTGDDRRAVSLARIAADLAVELDTAPPLIAPPVRASPLPRSAMHIPPLSTATAVKRHEASAPRAPADGLPENGSPPSSPAQQDGAAGAAAALPRQAVHVSVEPSTEDGAWLVRVLGDGEEPRVGTHEALLVALSPNTNLLDRARRTKS